jgi:hypothetical protein
MSEDRGELSPAEQRLIGLLLLLRDEVGRSDAALTERVMRGVRLQFLARGFARAVGSLVAAALDGIALVLGRSGRTRRV